MLPRILVLFISVLFTSVLVTGCSPDSGNLVDVGPVGPRGFGERCRVTEDCASGLCVRTDDKGGVCSRTCENDRGCPAASNWKCVEPSSLGASVCGCRASASKEICANGFDDDCDGKVDDCLLCDGKLVEPDDPSHCGACNRACREDQRCSDGACACSLEGRQECGGRCVDVKVDPKNCGACGSACSAEQVCKDGVCNCPSPSEPEACPSGCVDKKTDSRNCGACGNSCGSGQVCREGQCTCPSTAQPTACPTGCVDLRSDTNNCGTCGNACKPDFVCSNATCTCPGGGTACGDVCVDARTDRNHCGACGNVCRADQLCAGSACICQFGTNCGGQCISTLDDEFNCGACGRTCRPGEYCSSGICRCDSGVICGGTCKPQNDALNCGACGNACGGSQYCSSGACRCNAWDQTACGTTCVNTLTSTTNCGACGNTCRPSEICSSGRCSCPAGMTWCDVAGACVDLRSNTAHCGGCGQACRPTESCSNSSCRCSFGSLFCESASACVDTVSNNAHCGVCDRACPSETQCTGGTCRCTAAGRTLCGATCVDVQTDEANCGACGAACPGTQVCNAGKCQCETPVASAPFRITNAPLRSWNPTLVWNGTHAGLAWLDARNTTGANTVNLFFTLLNADGTRASSDLQLTNFRSEFSSIPTVNRGVSLIWTGTQWTVAWTEVVQVGNEWRTQLRLRGIDPAGTLGAMDVTIAPTGVGNDTRMSEASVAWSPTEGYGVIYIGASTNLMFRRLGLDAAAPETPVNLTIPNDPLIGIAGTRLAVSPSGEWAAFAQQANVLVFFRLNADGSRTKNIISLPNVGYDVADLIPEGSSSWLTTFVREEYVAGRRMAYLTIARGNDLSSRQALETVDISATPNPLTMPRLLLDGTTLEAVFARTETWGSTSSVQFKRWSLPAASGVAPSVLAERVAILSTPNHELYSGIAAARVGANLLATWTDNRWGDYELYGASVDLHMCP